MCIQCYCRNNLEATCHICYTSLLSSGRRHSSLSYSRLQEMLLEKISSLGVDPKSFGMHSVWAGGASSR